jgi:TetR/AcrR family transcriptional regulator, transcriptional repressor of aconitase
MPKVSQAYLDARRGEILDAAIVCFSREGFHRTTMAEIVKESGVSPGAIYNYFDGKEEIIEAIAEERREVELALIAEATTASSATIRRSPGENSPETTQAGTVVSALRRLRDAFFGDLKNPKERLRRRLSIQLWAEAQRNPRILKLVRGSFEGPLAMLSGILAEAQRRGEISKEVDAEATARFLIGAFYGLVLQVEWEGAVRIEPQIELLDVFLGSISVGGKEDNG